MTLQSRNPKINAFGGIDCEVNHPVHGWIPFTASPDDPEAIGVEIFTAALAEAAPYVAPPPAPEPEPDSKLTGIEFEGVMCSATADDQNGLAAVLLAVQMQGAAFPPTRFFFANGNTLVISLENYEAFAAVWLPFRQSFFQP